MTNDNEEPLTPELDKLSAARKDRATQEIGEFLEWLDSKGILLVRRHDHYEADYISIHQSTESLLAEYVGVDLVKVEEERRALINWLQQQAEKDGAYE